MPRWCAGPSGAGAQERHHRRRGPAVPRRQRRLPRAPRRLHRSAGGWSSAHICPAWPAWVTRCEPVPRTRPDLPRVHLAHLHRDRVRVAALRCDLLPAPRGDRLAQHLRPQLRMELDRRDGVGQAERLRGGVLVRGEHGGRGRRRIDGVHVRRLHLDLISVRPGEQGVPAPRRSQLHPHAVPESRAPADSPPPRRPRRARNWWPKQTPSTGMPRAPTRAGRRRAAPSRSSARPRSAASR